MFVMMPQVHCVDGSRVKNMKKHFEVLSAETTPELSANSKCSSSSHRQIEASRRLSNENSENSVISETEKCQIRSVHHKEVKSDRCNIKRTPAFRCDRMVKGKNVTGQAKEKNISVEDKVKLFEDGPKKRDALTVKSQVLPDFGNEEPGVTLGSRNSNKAHKLSESHENLTAKVRKDHISPSQANISPLSKMPDTKVIYPSAIKPTLEDISHRRLMNNGFGHVKNNKRICTNNKMVSSEGNLSEILSSPLPPGPPPRKPPRTFAHGVPHVVGQLDGLSKASSCRKDISKNIPKISSVETSVKPILMRSKTESHIELKNKLETVLSKLQSSGENSQESAGHSARVDAKNKNLTHPCRSRPPSKPDLSPSSLLVSCLSLGCVSGHQYEEVGAMRQLQPCATSSDRRENMDLRSANVDATQDKNTVLSLVGSQNEDHVYAVPFVEMKESFSNISPVNSKFVKNLKNEPIKGPIQSENEADGLHYMCTPILAYGKLKSLQSHDDNTPLTSAQKLQSLRISSLMKDHPSLHPTGFMEPQEKSLNSFNVVQPHVFAPIEPLQIGMAEGNFHEGEGLTGNLGQHEFNSGSKSSLCSPSTETEDEDEQSVVTEEIVEQRKGYVRRMCSMFQKMETGNLNNLSNTHDKNSQNSKTLKLNASHSSQNSPSQKQSSSSSQHLFECFLLVGLTLTSDKEEGKNYEPYIQSKFPADVPVPPWIEHLCFPDSSDWPLFNSSSSAKVCAGDDVKRKDSKGDCSKSQSERGCTYSLVITEPNGSRRFGYCRRVLPEGGCMCLPLNYCIISPHRANGFYFKVLAELESRHGQPESERIAFLQELYSCPLPGPGQVLTPPPSSSPPSQFISSLRRPVDTRLEERDITELFSCLEVGVFLDIFASLLLERKVLLISKSLSKLSSCVEALQSVLYPLSWQHTFIPVLPAPMLDICNAPTPYIIGVLKGCNGQIPNITMDEGIMVDLDTSQCVQRVGDEGSILPSRIKNALQSALRIVSGLNTSQPYLRKKNSSPDKSTPVCNVLASEAFLRTFLLVMGHYPNHIVTLQDGHKVFEREAFIKSMPFSEVRMFLEWFTETAMFSAFINSRLGGSESGDEIFAQRAQKFCEESQKDDMLFLKNYKALTKKNKKFGDRLKDWGPFA